MKLSSGQRRELASKGNQLKASIIIKAADVSEAAVEHVRKSFGDKDLIKVRFSTRDRNECIEAANTLADGVPCELVQRVGRVALLYRPSENADKIDSDPPQA